MEESKHLMGGPYLPDVLAERQRLYSEAEQEQLNMDSKVRVNDGCLPVYSGPISVPPGHEVVPEPVHDEPADNMTVLFEDKELIEKLKAKAEVNAFKTHYPLGVDWEDMTPAQRKLVPVFSGMLMYFPDAVASVALVSMIGNDQHNPGEPLHWAREKSTDEWNTALRHMMEGGKRDTDGTRHTAKAAWRILAALQKEIEEDKGGL